MATFTERLKELRKKNKLTQKELAKSLGISRDVYANWENGRAKPDFLQLSNIAIYFNTSIDYLVGKIDKEYKDITPQEIQQMPKEDIKQLSQDAIFNAITTLTVGKLHGIPKEFILQEFQKAEPDLLEYLEPILDKVYSDTDNNNLTTKDSNHTN